MVSEAGLVGHPLIPRGGGVGGGGGVEGGGALAAFRNVRLSGRARQRQRAVQRQAQVGRTVSRSTRGKRAHAKSSAIQRNGGQCNVCSLLPDALQFQFMTPRFKT